MHKAELAVIHRKQALLEALEKSLGVVTTACKKAGVDRQTHYNYMKSDPEYKKAVDALSDVALDFAESKLFELINTNNVAGTIFYLKTKGKERGYVERTEQRIGDEEGKPLTINIIAPE